ncbi:hypothetical protein PPTG_00785 [Phytophthora nicotianae INRA-310]|uniref:Uncharacterized protein n=1 Tax=Phytophthora nicotianae (strain INRA-310) TaxID=761204 RepID=W2RGF4_PHYN3|nr:hypothetical protein PPTG_00785 [Phytophthora nicotianae INRA-310]ETN24482.1 hypothetical protein PPTG_00785 [Phytophthora nicotianae INRA-310]
MDIVYTYPTWSRLRRHYKEELAFKNKCLVLPVFFENREYRVPLVVSDHTTFLQLQQIETLQIAMHDAMEDGPLLADAEYRTQYGLGRI